MSVKIPICMTGLLVSLTVQAGLPERLHPDWFEKPVEAQGEAVCMENSCTCAEETYQWKDTSFRPKDTWVARTADRLVQLWGSYDKDRSRYTISQKKLDYAFNKLESEKIGNRRRLNLKRKKLAQDHKKIQGRACQILIAEKFIQINYDRTRDELKKMAGSHVSNEERGRYPFLVQTLERSMTPLTNPRKKIVLTSPIVTGTYKEEKYRLPVVDSSWLEDPDGVISQVRCTDEQCTCGEARRTRLNNDPAEELRRVYMKGYLAENWRFFLKKKKALESVSKDSGRQAKLSKEKETWGCKLKLSLYFIKVLNKDTISRIERKHQDALVENKPAGIFVSKRYQQLKKVLLFYAQTSRDDHLLF